jgi:hypothetical protein
MSLQLKGKSPGRNDQCPCESGLKFKNCHGDPTKQSICNRLVQEAMLTLIFNERIRQGIICEHGVAKEDKCIDCESVQELNLEDGA